MNMEAKIFIGFIAFLLLGSMVPLAAQSPDEGSGPLGPVVFQSSEVVWPGDNATVQYFPATAVSGHYLLVAWEDSGPSDSDILLSRKNLTQPWGTFEAPVEVDDTLRNGEVWDDGSSQKKVALAAEGDLVVAVWMDNREGKYLIYAGVSLDGGRSFGESTPVAFSEGVQKDPDVAVRGGTAYVVWEDTGEDPSSVEGRIYFAKGSVDGGVLTFSTPTAVSPPLNEMVCKYPDVWVGDEGEIYVTWSGEAYDDWDIYLSVSFDGGESFSAPINLVRETSEATQWYPDLVSQAGNVLVVWQDMREGNWDIYGTVARGGTMDFSSNFRVDSDTSGAGQYYPSLALSPNGTVYAAFADSRRGGYDFDIFMAYTIDWGGSFWGDFRVPDDITGKGQDHPSAICPGTGDAPLYVVYEDLRDGRSRIRASRWIPGEGGTPLPTLENVHVSPDVGGVGRYYYFKATYFHVNNIPPAEGYPKLYLYYRVGGILKDYPGSPFTMKRRLVPAQDMLYTNGEEYLYGIRLDSEVEYLYSIEVMAEEDFRIVNTTLLSGPVVDATPPECIEVSPVIEGWAPERTVICTATFRDTGAGVDLRFVEFSYSYRGEEGLDIWHRNGEITILDNHTVRASFPFVLANGTDNVIQFRAMDLVGNGYSYSPPLHFRYDGEGPHFELVGPERLPVDALKVNVTIRISDPGGTGVAKESVSYRFTTGGVESLGTWILAENSTLQEEDDSLLLKLPLQLSWGWDNFLQIRAKDLAGNMKESVPYQLPAVQTVISPEVPGNRPPSPPAAIYPKEVSDPHPHIFWPEAVDPDGDFVSYSIRIGTGPALGDVVNWTSLGGENFFDVPESSPLQMGSTYYVEVMASDGRASSVARGTISVKEDANHPPTPPGPLYPSSIPVENKFVQWDPSWDPDGDPVLYFVRAGSSPGEENIIPWETTYTRRYVELPGWLGPGRYWVQLMASDGKSFSRVATYELVVGIFRVSVEGVERITVMPDDSDLYTLNITNLGTGRDSYRITLSGSALLSSGIHLNISQEDISVPSGASVQLALNITTSSGIPGHYYLNITVFSPVTSASARHSIMIIVAGKEDFPSGLGPTPKGVTLKWYHIPVALIMAAGLLAVIREYLLYRKEKMKR